MRRSTLIFILCILVINGLACTTAENKPPAANPPTPVRFSTATTFVTPNPDYKNLTVMIDEKSTTLVDGNAEEQAAPGSASKIATRFLGKESFGDLNGDGQADVAFIITRSTGGSGTFYYLVAGLKSGSGYRGSNGVLLGDRIIPQSTSIESGVIVVKYADRKTGESLTTQPTVGVIKVFRYTGGKLAEIPAVQSK